MGTEDVKISFSEDGIDAIATLAVDINSTIENIGARRLHTVMERLMDEISFEATDKAGSKMTIDAQYVKEKLGDTIEDEDLSRFIL